MQSQFIVLKHHNYEVDPWDSVLKAPEPNNPTKTRYPGQCQQNLSIIDKITYGKNKYTTWNKEHRTCSHALTLYLNIIQTKYINRHNKAIIAEKTGRWELLQLHDRSIFSTRKSYANAQCEKRGLYFSNWIVCQGKPLSDKCIF